MEDHDLIHKIESLGLVDVELHPSDLTEATEWSHNYARICTVILTKLNYHGVVPALGHISSISHV